MINFLTAESGGLMAMILPMVLMLAIFYFLLIRPENKRKKEAEEMRASIRNGDVITTIGGIVGTVVDVKEKKFVIETSADRVRIEFEKWALSANESATARAEAEQKKAKENAAKAKAAKKAEK